MSVLGARAKVDHSLYADQRKVLETLDARLSAPENVVINLMEVRHSGCLKDRASPQ